MNPGAAAVPYVLRAVRWRPVLGAPAVGLLLAAAVVLVPGPLEAPAVVAVLRGVALTGAVGLAFLADDRGEAGVAVTPLRRAWRTLPRPLAAAPAAVAWWAGVLALVRAGTDAGTFAAVPVAAVSLEAAALALLAAAAGAAAARRPPHDGGGAAAAVVVGLAVAALLMPGPVAPFPAPGDPRWAGVHRGWAVVLAGSAAALVWAARDLTRARRRLPAHRRGARRAARGRPGRAARG